MILKGKRLADPQTPLHFGARIQEPALNQVSLCGVGWVRVAAMAFPVRHLPFSQFLAPTELVRPWRLFWIGQRGRLVAIIGVVSPSNIMLLMQAAPKMRLAI